ncbi:putative transcriptional regulator, Crp/Fnr family [Bradyrhizobium sp. STM 3843]|uniref:Crp/Fnr family transcriptional regulator n=1 Tax=Bradyrhizobium sp. STM 3843 TaxID=551947 RepID=UPI00024066B8|nr:Crp/Fnr family transcriptional regulator [Bradyrhizobium sp. STM 3843]CCE04854.1 putative transcriptional regulator, Crp/Fnr family [Bradyrhizobium sp. STM 3843]
MRKEDWTKAFPPLQQLPPETVERLRAGSLLVELPEGSRIFGPGQAPESFLLLLAGTIRVQQTSESGREIVLYRVHAGESCALTTACLMGYEEYQAEGIAETKVRAVAIPRLLFDDLIATSRAFRQFVFTAFSRRVTNLFRVIEEVAFERIDARLAQKLLALAGNNAQIVATHQELANELGSVREVISRQLNEFARRGWIKSLRGTVEITEKAALSRLAQHS